MNNPYIESKVVKAQASYYPGMVSVYIPKDPIIRRPEGSSRSSSTYGKLENDAEAFSGETNAERSMRRTKKMISDYILCNKFDMFITLTFADNRNDIVEKRKQMRDWLKNQRNKFGKFQYLIISEFHKDKESIHFHALFSGYAGRVDQAINPKTKKPLFQRGKQVYTLPGYTLGFTNVKLLGDSDEDSAKVAFYVKKYITKDIPQSIGKQRYWVSKGLALPEIEDNPEEWYRHVKPDWETETPNGKIMRFNYGTSPLSDMFIEAHQK